MSEPLPPVSRREVLAALGAAGAAALAPAGSRAAADLPLSARELWAWVRAQQVLEDGLTWLNTGTAGPALRPALVAEYRSREAINLDFEAYQRSRLAPDAVTRLVERIAAFAGAAADEIALTTGTTESLNIVANGLDFEPGDEVVLTTREHPAHLNAWRLQARRRGLVVREVPLPSPLGAPSQVVATLTEALTPRTRVLAFSHVQYGDGTLLPVAELCELARSRGIATLVDGAQAFGMLNYSVSDLGCDFYAAGFSKWMNGGHGMGLLYVRRDWLDRLWPLVADAPLGWDEADNPGLADPRDSQLRAAWPGAMRKFGTSLRMFAPLYQGLGAAFDLQERVGRARIEARIRELALHAQSRLREARGVRLLTPTHPFLWAGIMSFSMPAPSTEALVNTLAREDRVVVSHVTHGDGFDALRVCPHIYNTHDDVDRLLHALERRLI